MTASIDEGYIKYVSHWIEAPAVDAAATRDLQDWRRRLYEAGLIGHYAELNVGFGNISIRYGEVGQFLITGTQTGHLEYTTAEHYSLVTDYDIAQNTVSCRGPVQASSEAMTHAAIYELDSHIGAIVHVHSRSLWERFINDLPTTKVSVAYGTPEMAAEFRRLYAETDFGREGIAVMGGHDEGLIAFDASLGAAANKILALTEH